MTLRASRTSRLLDQDENVVIRDESRGLETGVVLFAPFKVESFAFEGGLALDGSCIAITCVEGSGSISLLADSEVSMAGAAVVGTVAVAAPSSAVLPIDADVIRTAVPTGDPWLAIQVTPAPGGLNARVEISRLR